MKLDQIHYRELFADILCEAVTYETIEENNEQAEIILAGFIDAIDSWLQYHQSAYKTYDHLRQRVLGDVYGTPEEVEREEDELPSIPEWPTIIQAAKTTSDQPSSEK